MQEKSYDTTEWSYDEDTGIGRILLNRPDSLNALSRQLRDDVVAGFRAFDEIDDDSDGVDVRVVIIEGAGDRAFCAGADITEFEGKNPGVFEPSPLYDVAEQFGAPVIAKIDGYALGGGLELALACDYRIASERSTVGQPEIDLGFIPGGGGTQRLAVLVGPSRAKELCMLGTHIDAEQAAEEGIINYVHPTDDLDDAVDEFANDLAEKPPLAVRAVKDVINMSQEMGLREGRRYEQRANDTLRETHDHQEGAAAFVEKRDPEFKGK